MMIYPMMTLTGNKKQFINIILVCLLLTLAGSCSERTLIRHYYVLELPQNVNDSTLVPGQGTGICEILRTKLPPAYDQQRIAVRERSHEISYYQYHYWAMNPAENLTVLLERQIQSAKLFEQCSSGNLVKVPDYKISSTVYRFEVGDIDDEYNVHLQMRIDLIDNISEKILVSHRFNRTKGLVERDLNLFAADVSKIYAEEINHFIKKVAAYLKNPSTADSAEK